METFLSELFQNVWHLVIEGSDMIGRKGYHSNWIIDMMQRYQRPILLQSVQKGCLV